MSLGGVKASGDLQSEQHPAPMMSDLVGEGLQSRRVTCVDVSCNVVVTIIGVAMIIFAAIICTTTAQDYGWISTKIPLYSIMGAVGLVGIVVTGISIKWIVESCQKWNKFRKDVSDVT